MIVLGYRKILINTDNYRSLTNSKIDIYITLYSQKYYFLM
jgi:hypothetical protein